eukprot:854056-Lingulodinium_polyedra.AAC.1
MYPLGGKAPPPCGGLRPKPPPAGFEQYATHMAGGPAGHVPPPWAAPLPWPPPAAPAAPQTTVTYDTPVHSYVITGPGPLPLYAGKAKAALPPPSPPSSDEAPAVVPLATGSSGMGAPRAPTAATTMLYPPPPGPPPELQ